MAGTQAGFNAAKVRTALQLAMNMGAPSNTDDQVTFVFLEQDEFSPESPEGDNDPYSWTQTATHVDRASTQIVVPVALEFATSGTMDGEGGMGEFDASRATLTVLDTDWAQVLAVSNGGPDQVLIGGVTYLIDAPGAMPQGLFDLTVYTLHLSARA